MLVLGNRGIINVIYPITRLLLKYVNIESDRNPLASFPGHAGVGKSAFPPPGNEARNIRKEHEYLVIRYYNLQNFYVLQYIRFL